ncbi:hypothetical protein [Piscibacillus sp. B03]|uniref:hypothetical protein n=1 Tax=Piscibacillus sp. B03 TaxID=3457430 RepID=UPI003FCD85A3
MKKIQKSILCKNYLKHSLAVSAVIMQNTISFKLIVTEINHYFRKLCLNAINNY